MENILKKHILPTNILLKEPKPEEKITKSNILIPNVVAPPTSLGKVVIVGEGVNYFLPFGGKTKEPIEEGIKVGDMVMYSPHAIQRVRYQDEDFVLLPVQHVLLYWPADEDK